MGKPAASAGLPEDQHCHMNLFTNIFRKPFHGLLAQVIARSFARKIKLNLTLLILGKRMALYASNIVSSVSEMMFGSAIIHC
jgi:hypothetical protein